MEDEPQTASQPPVDPISRPSSASTSASAAVTQLPGIAALAASTVANSVANEATQQSAPAPRAPQPPSTQPYHGASPAATTGGNGNNLPTCQNCSTSTTPLWRRDEFGSVLCNACGLFLKLHGRPRPISLKTDVIKSRNRVKTMRTDIAPKKKNAAQVQNAQAARRKSANGTDAVDSPISRTGTPSMYNQSLPSFMVDDPYPSTGVSGFGVAGEAGGSPMNGDRGLDGPQTHEQLIAHNSSLKTRVSELEFINELFRGRLSQLEQIEADAQRRQDEDRPEQSQPSNGTESEKQLQTQLEDSHRRENNLKRRLDELELELKAVKEAKEQLEKEMERPAKKPRIEGAEDEKTVDVSVAEPQPAVTSDAQLEGATAEATA